MNKQEYDRQFAWENLSRGDYFLGISLISNGYFSKDKILEFHKFIKDYATSFKVLIADSLEIWNYVYFKKMSLSRAQSKSFEIGLQYKKGYEKLHSMIPNFSVELSSEIVNHDDIRNLISVLKEIYLFDDKFNQAVKSQVIKNLGSKIQTLKSCDVPDTLSNYLIEELAITCAMYSGLFSDKQIQISPKKDDLLVQLYSNCFPNISKRIDLNYTDFHYIIYNP